MKKQNAAQIETVVSQILDQSDAICMEINEHIRKSVPMFLCFVSALSFFLYTDSNGNMPTHLRWVNNGCPWDRSGELKEDGAVDSNQAILDFFENEYTGAWTPSYESGRGKNWTTYGVDLSDYVLDCGEVLMEDVLKKYFPQDFSERDIDYLRDDVHDHFYDNTYANEFFMYGPLFHTYDESIQGLPEHLTTKEFFKIGKQNYDLFMKKLKKQQVVPFHWYDQWKFDFFRKVMDGNTGFFSQEATE